MEDHVSSLMMVLLSTTSNLNFPAEIVDDMCHFCGLDHLKKTLYLLVNLNDYYWNTSCDDGIFVMIQHIFMNFQFHGKFNFTEKVIAKSAQKQPAPTPKPPPLSNNNNNVVEVS